MNNGSSTILDSALSARDAAALHSKLLEAIDDRLAELAQDDHTHCLSGGYLLTPVAEGICLCRAGYCLCAGQWPPFINFFRCEVQARLAWFCLEAA